MKNKSKILCFLLLLQLKLISQVNNLNYFLEVKKQLRIVENLLDVNKTQDASQLLDKIDSNKIPFGLLKNYYTRLGELNFLCKKYDYAIKYFNKAIENGLNEKYIKYVSNHYDTALYFNKKISEILKNTYDSINLSYSNSENELFSTINKMHSNDQESRQNLLKHHNLGVKKKTLDSLQSLVIYYDSINVHKYDSICGIYGWISKKSVLFKDIEYLTILFHSDEKNRDKYIKIGYTLANRNLIDWSDVIDLQSYSYLRNAMLNDMKNYCQLKSIKYNDDFINNDFCSFKLYCLSDRINELGVSNKKTEVIEFVSDIKDIETRKIFLDRINSELLKNGVSERKIRINYERYKTKKCNNSIYYKIL